MSQNVKIGSQNKHKITLKSCCQQNRIVAHKVGAGN